MVRRYDGERVVYDMRSGGIQRGSKMRDCRSMIYLFAILKIWRAGSGTP